MYDPQDDALFGRDGRHKPSPIPELLTERGWGSSHGRLAFSNMNRKQDANMSEYAISTIGMLPKGYVIVNSNTIDFDPETAFRVGPHRVAIPVKELARDRRLTIMEQWELMNPRYVGTYFGVLIDSQKSRRPDFNDVYMEAIARGEQERFIAKFWIPEKEHEAAINRLRQRLYDLDDDRMTLKRRMEKCEAKVRRIKSDIAFQRLQLYNNIQKEIRLAEKQLEAATRDYYNLLTKMDNLRKYLKNYTI